MAWLPSKPNETVLHLGAHKTASTLLQNWLSWNAPTLAQRGIGVTLARHIEGTEFSQILFEISKPRPRTTALQQAKKNAHQIWQHLGCPERHIISKENILGEAARLYINAEPVLMCIDEIFCDTEVRIVFYVRRIDHFIESHILQQYAHGLEIDVKEVINSMGGRNWQSVIDPMERIFPGRVRVEFFERIHLGTLDFVKLFCNACGIDERFVDSSQMPSPSERNRSLSEGGLALLKQMLRSEEAIDRISTFRTVVSTHNTGTGARPSFLTPEQRSIILAQHQDSYRTLIERYANNDRYLLNAYSLEI